MYLWDLLICKTDISNQIPYCWIPLAKKIAHCNRNLFDKTHHVTLVNTFHYPLRLSCIKLLPTNKNTNQRMNVPRIRTPPRTQILIHPRVDFQSARLLPSSEPRATVYQTRHHTKASLVHLLEAYPSLLRDNQTRHPGTKNIIRMIHLKPFDSIFSFSQFFTSNFHQKKAYLPL